MIEDAGGWISFDDYMNAALYAPGLGYYVAGARKFGSEGDFVTAPELSPLFGAALAMQLAQVLALVPDADIIELGPGSGRLAADLLGALEARGVTPRHYQLLEVSPDLRARQGELLSSRVPEMLSRIQWLDVLPRRWRGVVVANEVLDAVPAPVVVHRGGAWFERGVALGGDGHFVWSERPLTDQPLRAAAQASFPALDGYASEINPSARALVRTLAQRCDVGAMIVVDYGFPAAEFYHPQRAEGTLMAHYRHHATSDPFLFPGLCDLTAHVDFSAIAGAGVAGGMSVAGYTSQAQFLLNCGILDQLARAGDPASVAYLRESAALQKILQPSEMGELFKVLALSRGIDAAFVGFEQGDRSHRL